jgi:hypothetical protein
MPTLQQVEEVEATAGSCSDRVAISDSKPSYFNDKYINKSFTINNDFYVELDARSKEQCWQLLEILHMSQLLISFLNQ